MKTKLQVERKKKRRTNKMERKQKRMKETKI